MGFGFSAWGAPKGVAIPNRPWRPFRPDHCRVVCTYAVCAYSIRPGHPYYVLIHFQECPRRNRIGAGKAISHLLKRMGQMVSTTNVLGFESLARFTAFGQFALAQFGVFN